MADRSSRTGWPGDFDFLHIACLTFAYLTFLAGGLFENSGVRGQFASGGGDYSGQKKAVQLMPGLDALWTASRGEIQDGIIRILLLVDF